MAIIDTVWGRLVRFNPPRRMRQSARPSKLSVTLRTIASLRLAVLVAVLALLGWAAVHEIETSQLQAWLFTRLDRGISFTAAAGPSDDTRFPKSGPYDQRLGYTQLPEFINSLVANRYTVADQARWSPGLARFVGVGAFPIYQEKDHAGLSIYDQSGAQLYGVQFPGRTYPDFASIPPLVVASLTFIEDRYLFDRQQPERNPAVEWARFALAAGGRVVGVREGGGSTLATQIEKFRHSPGGVTERISDKFRQMLTASARAYMGGSQTANRRRQIVTTYLNSTPLASMPGYGEVIGIPEALNIWFGTENAEAAKILNARPRNAAELARKGLVYRQVLGLLLSERRPTYYLIANRQALAPLIDKYLRLLCQSGVIDAPLRDAADHRGFLCPGEGDRGRARPVGGAIKAARSVQPRPA
jgi:membrane peptidoglycan carboxypeptidase